MQSIGKTIAALRRERGMTQAELGARLNVSYQAVSKWENDVAQPDFSTMIAIADLFGVPLTLFQDGNREGKPAQEGAQEGAQAVLGTCVACGNVVREGEEAQRRPTLLCRACDERRQQEAERVVRQKQVLRTRNVAVFRARICNLRRSGIITGIVTFLCAVLVLSLGVFRGMNVDSGTEAGVTLGVSLLLAVFATQLPWRRLVRAVVLAYHRQQMGLFSRLVFLLTFPVMVVAGIVISPFTLIPSYLGLMRSGPDEMFEPEWGTEVREDYLLCYRQGEFKR